MKLVDLFPTEKKSNILYREILMNKKNVGSIDRIARIVLGIGIMVAGYVTQNWLGAIGIVPLVTGVIGWCPAYLPFGINTCKTGSNK